MKLILVFVQTDLASDITEYDPDPTWKLVDESFPIFR